jgi:hypothetical protein
MIDSWLSHEERLWRHKELIREAEREQLIRRALAGREKRDAFYRVALAWLGCRLVEWGESLQQRYDNTSPASPACCQSLQPTQ